MADESKDPSVEWLGDTIVLMRSRVRTLHDRWVKYHAAWSGQKTTRQFSSDIFNTFVPSLRRSVERAVIRLKQMLLPSPDFFEVYPGDEYADEPGKEAEAVRSYMVYLFTKRFKAKNLIKPMGRTYYLYGRAAAKSGIAVDIIGGIPMVWPSVRAVDPFSLYLWPETAMDIDDAQIVAEDHMMPYERYERFVRSGRAEALAKDTLTNPEWPWHVTSRLTSTGMTPPTDSTSGGDAKPPNPAIEHVALTEAYYRESGVWKAKWLVWNVSNGPKVVRRFVPLLGRPPYRLAVARSIPGQHYTTGMGDDLESLCGLLNDEVDMSLEAMLSSFPIAVIDPVNQSRTSTFAYGPRKKWLADPSSLEFKNTPDSIDSWNRITQTTLGLIDSFSGSNPLAEGQPTRGLPRAGFAVSSLLNLSLSDIRDAAQDIEDDILTPLLGDIYALTMLHIPRGQLMKIPGTQNFPPYAVTPADLAGDWSFQWVGSLQAQDFQVRGQRLVSVLSMLGKLGQPIQEDLARKGKTLNWEALLKRIWRDGLGERGADNMVVDMSAEEKALYAQQQAAVQGGGASTPGGAPGGSTAAPPASVEQMVRTLSRNLTESSVGQAMGGTGQG